jgi:hypothetical protein
MRPVLKNEIRTRHKYEFSAVEQTKIWVQPLQY